MKIYFGLSNPSSDLIEVIQKGSKYSSVLHINNLFGFTIATTPGRVLDALYDGEIDEPYAICGAEVDDSAVVEGLRAALVGDVVKSINIEIDEIIKVQY